MLIPARKRTTPDSIKAMPVLLIKRCGLVVFLLEVLAVISLEDSLFCLELLRPVRTIRAITATAIITAIMRIISSGPGLIVYS